MKTMCQKAGSRGHASNGFTSDLEAQESIPTLVAQGTHPCPSLRAGRGVEQQEDFL